MSVVLRLWMPLGLLIGGALAAADLRAADEPTGDLTPVPPVTRSLLGKDNADSFRNYGNGGAQSLSSDGKKLLMSGNGLLLWDLTAGHLGKPRTLDSENIFNTAGALSPDGKLAVLAPMYGPYGNGDMAVRFFDTTTGKPIREIDNDQQIFGLALAPDGRFLAVSTQQGIELWNADNGEEVRIFPAGQNVMYRLMTFSPDGRMIAALGNEPDTVHVWETASGKERAVVHFGAAPAPRHAGRRGKMFLIAPFADNNANNNILALAFSADSRLLAVSKQDSAIHLWNLHGNRELAPLTGFRGQVSAMVFSPDGKELIAVDSEGTHLSWQMEALRRHGDVRLTPLNDDDFAELWNDLAESDVFRVYRARRHLAADPKRAVPLLSSHLQPVSAGDTERIEQTHQGSVQCQRRYAPQGHDRAAHQAR